MAALGMRFYTGKMFPKEYQNNIFVAEHGSWNRRNKIGYRIKLVRVLKNSKVIKQEVFAEGWLEQETPGAGRSMCWLCPTGHCSFRTIMQVRYTVSATGNLKNLRIGAPGK